MTSYKRDYPKDDESELERDIRLAKHNGSRFFFDAGYGDLYMTGNKEEKNRTWTPDKVSADGYRELTLLEYLFFKASIEGEAYRQRPKSGLTVYWHHVIKKLIKPIKAREN